VVVEVAEDAGDPEAWAAAAPATASAAAVGWNVATNGERTGVGKTTGTLSTAKVTEGVPIWTVTVPVAGTTWTDPAWSSPAHRVEPEDELVTATQQVPLAVTVTL
jgi:hypothetical protein